VTKYQPIDAGRSGSGRIDLATGELEFSHEDMISDSNILPIGISHTYLSKHTKRTGGGAIYGKGFRLNLQQKLVKVTEDGRRYDYFDATDMKHEFEEKYYYKVNGEKIYQTAGVLPRDLRPDDIVEEYDGRLFYIENPEALNDQQIRHTVFTKLVAKNGLVLHKGTKHFKGSEKIDRRHEEIIQTDEEIESLKKNIREIGFMITEYGKFDFSYRDKNNNVIFTYDDLI
jgi:hypothetical protein